MTAVVNRGYRAVERRWLKEFIEREYPDAHAEFEKKLTFADPAKVAQAGGKVSPRFGARIVAKLDAWVTLSTEIHAYEAKQYAGFGAISQLTSYRFVLPHTWEGQNQAEMPITWHLLASHHKPEIEEAAKLHEVSFHVYLPDWLHAHQVKVQEEGRSRRLAYLASKQAGAPPS